MASKISNEVLCGALLANGTVKATAEALHISESTVYNMMNQREFKSLYEYTQASILNGCMTACQSRLTEAVNCMADIMNDKSVNAQTRLMAAQSIIKNAVTMHEVTEKMKESAEDKLYSVI